MQQDRGAETSSKIRYMNERDDVEQNMSRSGCVHTIELVYGCMPLQISPLVGAYLGASPLPSYLRARKSRIVLSTVVTARTAYILQPHVVR